MSSISSEEIISILKNEIENFDQISKDSEVGTVVSVGDGIANIYGIEHAMYGEIVTFENGLKGMVQDIQKDTIGCILFGSDVDIKEGTKVMRTKKKAGVPVGDKFIGRVVNALGAPIDGAGEIEAEDYRPIENEAPGIIDRKSVSVPMETGILSIDFNFCNISISLSNLFNLSESFDFFRILITPFLFCSLSDTTALCPCPDSSNNLSTLHFESIT